MSLKLPIVNADNILSSQVKPQSSAPQKGGGGFEPIAVDLETMNLSSRIKNLIRHGEGFEKYNNDHSAAVFAACIAMHANGFSDQEIASVLTDRENHLADTAYRHANTQDRTKAATWIFKYGIPKAKERVAVSGNFGSAGDSSEQAGKIGKSEIRPRKLHLTFVSFKEIKLRDSGLALVEDFINLCAFVLLLGAPGSGKTFLALDLAMHVALGRQWFGRKVERGAVLYIAAEGSHGITTRIMAFKKAYGLEDELVPFRLAYGTADLCTTTHDALAVIEEIKETSRLFGLPVRLVVIDTLSQVLSGGDENSPQGMGALVKNVQMIRHQTESTILLVHHTGKDESRGARGHSSLNGALDTELIVTDKNGAKKVTNTKQRDRERTAPLGLRLEPVEVGVTADSKPITSCVVRSGDFDVIEAFSQKPLNQVAHNALETLRAVLNVSDVGPPESFGWPKDAPVVFVREWRVAFKNQHYGEKSKSSFHDAFKRACEELSKLGRIEIRGDHVRLLPK